MPPEERRSEFHETSADTHAVRLAPSDDLITLNHAALKRFRSKGQLPRKLLGEWTSVSLWPAAVSVALGFAAFYVAISLPPKFADAIVMVLTGVIGFFVLAVTLAWFSISNRRVRNRFLSQFTGANASIDLEVSSEGLNTRGSEVETFRRWNHFDSIVHDEHSMLLQARGEIVIVHRESFETQQSFDAFRSAAVQYMDASQPSAPGFATARISG